MKRLIVTVASRAMPVQRSSLFNDVAADSPATQDVVLDADTIEDRLKHPSKRAELVEAYRTILQSVLGPEGALSDGVLRTPERCADALLEMTRGYKMDPVSVVNDALFCEPLLADNAETADSPQRGQVVIVRDITVHSLCEHHMLPFHGVVHIAYLPGANGIVLGLSKLARLVEVYARRLQLQERLGRQIAQAVVDVSQARGAAVRIEARHMCMEMRGVQKHGATTVTTVLLGAFEHDANRQAQFFAALR